MDYHIVIPSYKRSDSIQLKTLKTLEKYVIPLNKITIWVANEDEYRDYERAIPEHKRPEIRVGVLGLVPQRNKILESYPIDAKLVFMDDDIEDVVQLLDNKLVNVGSLVGQINIGFLEAEKAGTILWGIGAVPNAFFMRNKITTDLKFCIGCMFGLINKGPMDICFIHAKEDYIRTLIVWETYGAVVRLNYLASKTQCYKGHNVSERLIKEQQAVDYILGRWPDLVRLNTRRKSPYPEILLKRKKNI